MRADEAQNFWINLGKIQDALSLSDEDFSKYLSIDYLSFLKKKKQIEFLPLNCVFECAENLNFHFEDLLSSNFSAKSIFENIKGNTAISDKYLLATHSTTQPIRNLINYIDQTRGERAKINFFRKFQITDNFLDSPEQRTNILLMTDAVQYLKQYHQFSNDEFMAIGRLTPTTITNKIFKKNIVEQKNIHSLVDYFVNGCAHLFDKNFTYKIDKMTSDFAIIEAIPNKNVLDELSLKADQFGSEEVCLTRMGVISSITSIKYNHFAELVKINSVYAGNSSHRYLFDMTPFTKLCSFPNPTVDGHAVYH